jgi:hypothetical protein
VRVGRAALDEDAIRLIESNNPDVEFDWTRILKGQADPEIVAAPDRRDRRPERPERERQAPKAQNDRRAPRPVAAAQPPEPAAEAVPPPTEPMTAAQARLGFEGLVRLRARYGETMARITERIPDPDQQAQLKTLAERLNPDAWVTDADVSDGLESYESTYEALRGTIGNRRRNPRPEAAESE